MRLSHLLVISLAIISSSAWSSEDLQAGWTPEAKAYCHLIPMIEDTFLPPEIFERIASTPAGEIYQEIAKARIANAMTPESVTLTLKQLSGFGKNASEFLLKMAMDDKKQPWVRRLAATSHCDSKYPEFVSVLQSLVKLTPFPEEQLNLVKCLEAISQKAALESAVELYQERGVPDKYDSLNLIRIINDAKEPVPKDLIKLLRKLQESSDVMLSMHATAAIYEKHSGLEGTAKLNRKLSETDLWKLDDSELKYALSPLVDAIKKENDKKLLWKLYESVIEKRGASPSQYPRTKIQILQNLFSLGETKSKELLEAFEPDKKFGPQVTEILQVKAALKNKERDWEKEASELVTADSPSYEKIQVQNALFKMATTSANAGVFLKHINSPDLGVILAAMNGLANRPSEESSLAIQKKLKSSSPEEWFALAILSARTPHLLPSAKDFLKGCPRSQKMETRYFGGQEFPRTINHELKFPEIHRRQLGGTCHVYAAAALFEEYCHRVTGKFVQISRPYLIYKHFRQKVQKLDKPPQVKGSFFEDSIDGGMPYESMAKILKGNVCSEKELPLNTEQLSNIIQAPIINKDGHYTECCQRPATTGEVCRAWDSEIKCRLDSTSSHWDIDKGTRVWTKDPVLVECLESKPEMKPFEPLTAKQAVQLLEKGYSIQCNKHFTYDTGESGPHAFLIVGYNLTSSQFYLRDSNRATLSMDMGGPKDVACQSAMILQN